MVTICNCGFEGMAKRFNNSSVVNPYTVLSTGTDPTAESTSDISLGAENTTNGFARASATCGYTATGIATLNHLFTATGAGATVREIGIHNQTTPTENDIFLRHVLVANKSFTEGEALEVTATITFSQVS